MSFGKTSYILLEIQLLELFFPFVKSPSVVPVGEYSVEVAAGRHAPLHHCDTFAELVHIPSANCYSSVRLSVLQCSALN